MWDGTRLGFFLISDADNPSTVGGNFPAATIRVPRGKIFHGEVQGAGPPPHTIHWHGIEPTALNDGVGHCSMEIGRYLYQFQPNFIGTYFYHCHRNTVQHFEFGLYGLLIIEPPNAYDGPNALGFPRRTAANLAAFPQFPGFNASPLESGDPEAMTVPYDVEAFWVAQTVDPTWHITASDPRAFFPAQGNPIGLNDSFPHGFFNDYRPKYFFITSIPLAAPAESSAAIPSGLALPPALNSGVTGTQISINARVGQTIFIRCLDASYGWIRVMLPPETLDLVIIEWDGRALGVPPCNKYTHPILVPAGTPIEFSVARRFGALMRATAPISTFATVEFMSHEGNRLEFTARIPINITP
ncbi:MAG: multicopper oxidase domain-containing protein [Deltaproteobacteria bacterium]|nr:multicopper oxidase domain-containing protein [Deltaproteobacteria bacterium]